MSNTFQKTRPEDSAMKFCSTHRVIVSSIAAISWQKIILHLRIFCCLYLKGIHLQLFSDVVLTMWQFIITIPEAVEYVISFSGPVT